MQLLRLPFGVGGQWQPSSYREWPAAEMRFGLRICLKEMTRHLGNAVNIREKPMNMEGLRQEEHSLLPRRKSQ